MTNHPQPEVSLTTVMVDELKDLTAEIRLRLDLQQRNTNVLIVLVTAVTGYIANYIGKHTLSHGATSLVHSEILTLVALVPIIVVVFIWRHLDHDVNIIDKAAYINSRLRPWLEEEHAGELGFERFLGMRRAERPKIVGKLIELGQDHLPMFFIAAAYLAAGWYAWAAGSHAGTAHAVFDLLLYVGTAAILLSLVMAWEVGNAYASVGADPAELGGRNPGQLSMIHRTRRSPAVGDETGEEEAHDPPH